MSWAGIVAGGPLRDFDPSSRIGPHRDHLGPGSRSFVRTSLHRFWHYRITVRTKGE